MILIDYSQVAISNLHQQLKGFGGGPQIRYNSDTGETEIVESEGIQPNLLRHMILNSIRRIKKEHGAKFGRIVLCTDSRDYWRKGVFPYYKAKRKKTREDSEIDWDQVFDILNGLRDEIRDYFPYKVMNVLRAEADDVIAVLTKHYHTEEPILIVSGDKDFMQLQRYPNVQQYSPVKNEFLVADDPLLFLKEHIIRGDSGDGIPNFLSPDDVFVTEKARQKSIMAAKVEVWLNQEPEEFCDEALMKNWERNKMLVDLTQIPSDIENTILAEFATPIKGDSSRIYSYLIKMRMKNLMECIDEF